MLTSSQKNKKNKNKTNTNIYMHMSVHKHIYMPTNNLEQHPLDPSQMHKHGLSLTQTHTHTPPPIKGDPRTIASVPQRLHKSSNMRVLV